MEFIITIDTEADNQWNHGRELTVENLKFVPRFQELCNEYSIKPTYLVTSEVCTDPYSKEIFTDYQRKGIAEIGAHLHSWTTPPFLDKEGYRYNDRNHTFATELPENILIEKIKNLTNQIEMAFGKRPTSFRSGRYGFNECVARILSDNFYMVDSSVTPYTNWSNYRGMPDGMGGPDFLKKSAFPFTYNFSEKSILEIPVTILNTKYPLNKNQNLASYYLENVDKRILLRLFRKLFFSNQPLWLRPFIKTKIRHLADLIGEAKRIDLPYLVMMFHSSELMPGCSIYRTDKESVEKLYELLEQFFELLKNENIASITLSEAAETYKL